MGWFDWLVGGGSGGREAETSRPPGARQLDRGSPPAPTPPRKRRVTKIEREVLELVFESARDSHPQEFGAVLRRDGDTIKEILVVPTVQGDAHAIMYLGQLPVDPSACGTIHSHPTPNAMPSHADEQLFRGFGHTHIIVGYPYRMDTWQAYDHDARPIDLEVV